MKEKIIGRGAACRQRSAAEKGSVYGPWMACGRSCSALVLAFCIMLSVCSSSSAGPSASLNLDYTTADTQEDGEEISSQTRFFRSFFFRFDKPLTPVLSYQLSFRTNWVDTKTTDASDVTLQTYDRSMEPTMDLLYRSAIYDFGAGYRRLERWSIAHLRDPGRRTEDFTYARFSVNPYELPALSLQIIRQRDFDHFQIRKEDRTNNQFIGISTYELAYKDLRLSYNLTYGRSDQKTPLEVINRTKNDTFSGLYKIGYLGSFWGGRATVTALYQGNYIRTKSRRFSDQAGDVVLERTPLRGLVASCESLLPPDLCRPVAENPIDIVLNTSEPRLIDNDLAAGIGNLNIGSNGKARHHMGVDILSDSTKPIDRIFLYVNRNVSTDAVLRNPGSWQVFRSDSNIPGTWSPVAVTSVAVTPFDTINEIFRYELRLVPGQTGRFFKVVNLDRASLDNVLVTEAEVYGSEFFSTTREDTNVNTFFNQELNVSANVRPAERLRLDFSYFVSRTDNEPRSPANAVGGLFTNVLSRSLPKNGDTTVSLIRSYNSAVTWETHRFLTTALRFSRVENFDNTDAVDFASNTYSLTLTSLPLPTLDTNFTLLKTDNDLFGEKDSTSRSILFNIGARLYKDLRLIADAGLTNSQSFTTGVDSTSRFIRGTIDAQFTPRLFATVIFGLDRTTADDTSSRLGVGRLSVTYRPGRNISITGNFGITSDNGLKTVSRGLSLDWLPVAKVRLTMSYEFARSDKSPKQRYSFNSFGTWYITKFLDFRASYAYAKDRGETETVFHSWRFSLNSRFW